MADTSEAQEKKTVNHTAVEKGRLYHLDVARVLAIALVTLYHMETHGETRMASGRAEHIRHS